MTSPSIEEATARVEAELRDLLSARKMPLYRMMAYHLGWEDELGNARDPVSRDHSRGVACLTACDASNGDVEVALPAAASVELVNSFCQVHDEVQGGQPKRDDRDAVWWVWGPAQAINAGDGMHALARLAIFRLQERGVTPETTFQAVRLLDEASLEVCEGRFRDLEAQERIDLDVDGYLKIASSKTGSLYSCAMKLGALAAGADEVVIEAMGVCGEKLGVAAQIQSDLRQLWSDGEGESSPSPEVLNKKKLLPVVYALEVASLSEKRRMGDIYFKRVLNPEDVGTVRQLLDELNAREYCEELVGQYKAEAQESVAVGGISKEGAAAVNGLVDSLLDS